MVFYSTDKANDYRSIAYLKFLSLILLLLLKLDLKITVSLGLRSDLVPEHGARERFLMGTNVNTPFVQVPTPEFGHSARARVQGLDLILGH